ncbi:hypothetical protein HY623_03250 [Candidatus Uhrbacteria bacterium]|nr:hypothetical protein [Candidatus Uhrbacteria bacterium]
MSEGYAYGSATTCDNETACLCSGTGTGGGGAGGSGASAGSGSGSGGSTGAAKSACPGAFLSPPSDPVACGVACGKADFRQSKFDSDGFSNGAAKCCCYERRGASTPNDEKNKAAFGPEVASPFGPKFNVPELIGDTLRRFLEIIGIIALVIFIYGGFLWMISLGDETRVKRGRETMIWAGMGLIAILGSYIVIKFILDAVL